MNMSAKRKMLVAEVLREKGTSEKKAQARSDAPRFTMHDPLLHLSVCSHKCRAKEAGCG